MITFGNQVSSALLKKPVKVSGSRRKPFVLKTKNGSYTTYATYYPVGMGMMNMGKAVEDVKWILLKHATKKASRHSTKQLSDLRHKTLIESTGSSLRLSDLKVTNK